MNWLRITFELSLEFQTFTHGHDGNTMTTQISIHYNLIARADLFRRYFQSMLHNPHARCVDKNPVAPALFHNLGIPGNDLNTCASRCLPDGAHNPD